MLSKLLRGPGTSYVVEASPAGVTSLPAAFVKQQTCSSLAVINTNDTHQAGISVVCDAWPKSAITVRVYQFLADSPPDPQSCEIPPPIAEIDNFGEGIFSHMLPPASVTVFSDC